MDNQDKNKDLLNAALNYLSRGWSIIPINPSSKKPCLESWLEYQRRLPTIDEVNDWWTKWPWASIGLVTGEISGVSVIDVDPRHGGISDNLTDTVKSQTGGGGFHYFYLYNHNVHSQNGVKDGIDLKSDGGYVILPPSIHASGNKYTWITPPFVNEFQEMPQWIIDLQGTNKSSTNLDWKSILAQTEGARDINLYRAACSLLARGIPSKLVYQFLLFINSTFQPPLATKEVNQKFESGVNFLTRGGTKNE